MTMYWRDDAKMWWPDCELERVYKWMIDRIDSVEKVMRHVPKTRRQSCVQAGGYIGMWPRALSAYFMKVHTFEPVHQLYDVMVKNLETRLNVHSYKQVLGETCCMTQVAFKQGGKSCVEPRLGAMLEGITQLDDVPMVTIDSLQLQDVGLIYLDVERGEIEAVRGARLTIERDRPVIVLEILDDQVERYPSFMRSIGYNQVDISHRDAIFKSAR